MTAVLARLLTVFHLVVFAILILLLGGIIFGLPTARAVNLIVAVVLSVGYFGALFREDTRKDLGDFLVGHPVLSTVSFVWVDITVAAGCVLLATGGIPLPDWFGRTPGVFEFLYPALVIALYAALPVLALFASWYALVWVVRGGVR